ncbi:neuronal acetylcholine receptor subunit alpha-6-like [Saccoglossus kowalevskii]
MILVAISTGMNVIVLKFWHHGPDHKEVPSWLRKLVLEYMVNILCMKGRFDDVHAQGSGVPRDTLVILDADGRNMICKYDSYDNIVNRRRSSSPPIPLKPPASPTDPNTKAIVNELKELRASLNKLVQRSGNEDHESDVQNEWKQVACVIDRMFLWLFIILSSLMFIMLTAQMMKKP